MVATFVISLLVLNIIKRHDAGAPEGDPSYSAMSMEVISTDANAIEEYGLSNGEVRLTEVELAAMLTAEAPGELPVPLVEGQTLPRPGRPAADQPRGDSVLGQLWEEPRKRSASLSQPPTREVPPSSRSVRAVSIRRTAELPAVAGTVTTGPEAGYWLQTGAFQTAKLAEAHRERIDRLGLESRVESARINGGMLHRVRLGPYLTPGEIDAAKRQLAQAGIDAMAIRSTAAPVGREAPAADRKPAATPAPVLPETAAVARDSGVRGFTDGGNLQPGYWLQAGAFGSADKAEARKVRIGHLGLDSRVEPAGSSLPPVYRVRLGPYRDRNQVESVKRKLADGGIASFATGMSVTSPQSGDGVELRPGQAAAAVPAMVSAQASLPATGSVPAPSPERLVQTGAFRAVEQAEAHRAWIALLGLPARIEPVQVDGQVLHRVRLGPYASDDEVADVRRRLAAAGVASTVATRNRTAAGKAERQ